jgi:hypothetical protein
VNNAQEYVTHLSNVNWEEALSSHDVDIKELLHF